jgi:hypothetical protein
MHDGYYQNILYPLQDRVLEIVESTQNRFYLTGGTALSRAYLNHRYSDDLDFFVNRDHTYKEQVERIVRSLELAKLHMENAVFQEGFSRMYIQEHDKECSLKIDFINDVDFRVGDIIKTDLFVRTDTMRNILSNKLTALTRLEAKDVVDIVGISLNMPFHWRDVFEEAERKDLWVNPVDAASLLEQFPLQMLNEIAWVSATPDEAQFQSHLQTIITDILAGSQNSLKE